MIYGGLVCVHAPRSRFMKQLLHAASLFSTVLHRPPPLLHTLFIHHAECTTLTTVLLLKKPLHPLCSRLSLRQVQPLPVLKALFNPQSRFSMRAPESEGRKVGEVRREKRQQAGEEDWVYLHCGGASDSDSTPSGGPGFSEAALRAETLRQLQWLKLPTNKRMN
ncbi:hypothetical protein SRHO_G00015570 [Serrasalmus rhombeus]